MDKGQTMIYKTLHRKLNIKQHETPLKMVRGGWGWVLNLGALEKKVHCVHIF